MSPSTRSKAQKRADKKAKLAHEESATTSEQLRKTRSQTIAKRPTSKLNDLNIITEPDDTIQVQQKEVDLMDEDPKPPLEPQVQTVVASSSSPNTQPQPSANSTAPQPPAAPNAENDTGTNKNANTDKENQGTNEQNVIPEEAYEKITRRTEFRAATLLTNVKGKSKQEQLKEICRLFGHKRGYTGKTTWMIHKIPHMVIFFESMEDLKDAIVDPIPLDDEHVYRFVPFEEIKAPATQDEIKQTKQRTIQITDIPLDTRAPLVRSVFSKHGEIDRVDMQTRGLFQHAFIIYKTLDTVTHFKDVWAEFLERDSVRIFPLNMPLEERELRKKHSLKLSGFKSGTKARDLIHIINGNSAKSVFIPKNKNYRAANYAFFAFKSEQDAIKAAKNYYEFEGYKLHWGDDKMKTCHACGSPNHMIVECPIIKKRQQPKIDPKLQRLYNKFRPAQHRSRPKSYADAAKRNQFNNQRNRNNNITKGTATGGSMHDPQNLKDLGELRNIVNELAKQVKEIMIEFKSMKQNNTTGKPVQPIQNQNISNPNNKGKQNNKSDTTQSGKRTWNEAALSSSSSSDSSTPKPNQTQDLGSKLDKIASSLDAVTRRMDQMDDIVNVYGTQESVNMNLDDDQEEEGFFNH